MKIEIEEFCPLDKTCEEIKDGKIRRCRFYQSLAGRHPVSGEELPDRECVFVLNTIVGLEQARTNRGQTRAIESFRNETVKRQESLLGLVHGAAQQKRIK